MQTKPTILRRLRAALSDYLKRPGLMLPAAFTASVAGALVVPYLCSCALLPPERAAAALQAVESTVGNVVANYAATGKLDAACAIAGGLNAICALVGQTTSKPQAEAVIAAALPEYTGDASPEGKRVARQVATAVADQLDPTAPPIDKQRAVIRAGVAADAAATEAYVKAKRPRKTKAAAPVE